MAMTGTLADAASTMVQKIVEGYDMVILATA